MALTSDMSISHTHCACCVCFMVCLRKLSHRETAAGRCTCGVVGDTSVLGEYYSDPFTYVTDWCALDRLSALRSIFCLTFVDVYYYA